MFNGKDKTGWKSAPQRESDWQVKNGVLIWSSLDGSSLWTERDDFRDFHLRVETRISDRQYAWLIVRGGYVIILNSTNRNPNKTGSLAVSGVRGIAIDVSRSLVPPDQWFTLEAIAKGNRIIVKVNGYTTADYPDPGRRFARGGIALQPLNQIHEGQHRLEFRKIEIKELK